MTHDLFAEPGGLFGRTSQACSAATPAETLLRWLARWQDASFLSRQTIGVQSGLKVRRLTPTECERLQGFPDGWTAVAHRGKPAADGPRYRALGNSMAVPVIAWIGKQIEKAH